MKWMKNTRPTWRGGEKKIEAMKIKKEQKNTHTHTYSKEATTMQFFLTVMYKAIYHIKGKCFWRIVLTKKLCLNRMFLYFVIKWLFTS